jgi:hypothetical protein
LGADSSPTNSEARVILKAIRHQIIALAEWISSTLKSTSAKGKSDVFFSIMQAAAIANNCIFDEVVVAKEQVDSVRSSVTVESDHPFEKPSSDYIRIQIPGATSYSITFDGRSMLEEGVESVSFYKSSSCSECWGLDEYTSACGFPGVGGVPEMAIPADQFFVHFKRKHTDASSSIIPPPFKGSLLTKKEASLIPNCSNNHKMVLTRGWRNADRMSIQSTVQLTAK